MKTTIKNLLNSCGGALRVAGVMLALLAGVHHAGAQPIVTFTQPTNGQQIATFTNLAGTAQKSASGPVQQVTFAIYNQSIGLWWNGTNFQGAPVSLPATLSGLNWTPASSVALPAPCCGQYYQLTASATDASTNTSTTNITVQADSIPPVVTFAPLSNGQTVSNLLTIGGNVVDNFGRVASVVFSIHEQDINGGTGRWWNGTNFQGTLATLPASVSGTTWSPAPGVVLPQLNSGQSYDLTATATDTNSNSAPTTITVTDVMIVLGWDPGQTPAGSVVLQKPNTNGGNYWFQIIPQSPAVGVWRTALNVLAGQAGVYLRQGSPPNIYSYAFASANTNSNGFVVDASQFQPGQDWYILVNASTDANWNLVTGDAYVYPLGSLATDGSSSTNATIGAEGMVFYQTTIPSATLAWQLWLNGAPNLMFVKKSAAPDPVSYELTQAGQMLVVPPYLAGGTFNGSYFIGVSGSPGTLIKLDSRQQPVADLAFNSLTNVTVTATNFPYVTYRVQVPVQQIAWQLNLVPSSGLPNIAVRRDLVPNEFRNDAFSETPTNVGASVTLVPPPPQSGSGVPGLSDGTFFVTVYSTSPFACSFTNSSPVITDVHYLFSITNDAPTRAGWRYYRITTIGEQLGTLGWGLTLSNQVPGSEIAIRRNAVPGQWNQRTADDNYYVTQQGYVDLASIYGLLQQPGHQADIWYIGVYTPSQALGFFTLTGFPLTGQPVAFDGSTTVVTNQPPGQWGFFRIDVPADALGWDVRLVNVTNGSPQMVLSRDTLPTGLSSGGSWNGPYGLPGSSSSWPSGGQWVSTGSWAESPWGGCGYYEVPLLAMGMGNPLQAGTYYIGVQDPNNASSYTLQSRGIGLTNYAIRVKDLSINGSATNSSLNVVQGDYYRVVVPGNVPDWKLRLHATLGEGLLRVQKDYLPNNGNAYYFGPYGMVFNAYGGQQMMKPGDEQWALLPQNNGSIMEGANVEAGTYYVLVASQGQNITNSCFMAGSGLGSGSASYTLTSWTEPPTVLPDALSYSHDLLWTNGQMGGEMKFYQFKVPAGIASIEVRLENRVGNPVMVLNAGAQLVSANFNSWYPYGNYGGTNGQWSDGSLITVPNPSSVFSLSVYGADDGSSTYPDASYVVRVRAVPPPSVAYDGGTYVVTNQPPGQWGFFRIDVPADALGWDVRLVNVTNGSPQMVLSRDTLPTGLSSGGSWNGPYGLPGSSSSWSSGSQWVSTGSWAESPWGGCGYYEVPLLAMGMGNPLQAGTYYIGVQDPNNASSYTLQSRGIGLTNYAIRVKDLSINGSATNSSLNVVQGDYYRVVVPGNVPDWKLRLHATLGEGLLRVQKDYLPNNGNAYYFGPYGMVFNAYGGQQMMKPGDEQWALLPQNNGSIMEGANVEAGTYYVLVASQGQNITNSCFMAGSGLGSGSASYTLTSWTEPPTVLPDALSYSHDLLWTNGQMGGEMKFYQFKVPAGIASIEVRLENRVGNPVMVLSAGAQLVSANFNSWYPYGNYGGTNGQWSDGSLITVPNPSSVFSLSVYGADDGSGTYPDASYVVRVRAVPPPSVAYDGGTYVVTNQPPGQWGFFRVDVPADALGWDVRLVNVTNGSPQMVLSRDTLPTGLNSSGSWNGPYGLPGSSSSWPSGSQWVGTGSWAESPWGGCGYYEMPLLAVGMGNPLQTGTYYIGVQDPNNASSYTLQSRGIGLTNYTIRVKDLSINGSATNSSLNVVQGDYYRVVVPGNVPDWKLRLHATLGEGLLRVQKDYLPNNGNAYYFGPYGMVFNAYGGQQMMKPGDEQWALLPQNNGSIMEGTNVEAGTYYVLVASQGQNITNSCFMAGSGLGSGSASYTLTSWTEPPTVLPDALSYSHDLLWSNGQAGGEMKFYQFNVPAGIASIEVRLENRVGNPVMVLNAGAQLVSANFNSWYPYGNYGGTNGQWSDGSLITIPNPAAGTYSLSAYAAQDGSGIYADANYVLRVHAPVVGLLSFSSELNTSVLTNVVSGVLADNQRAFYQVTVPGSVNGASVLGWRLDVAQLNGTPSVRVRRNLLPDNTGDTTSFATDSAIIAPPYLTPGTWFVEVKGGGATEYSLATSVITTNTLQHPLWTMPALGQTLVPPGLSAPFIGDSGVNASGNPLPGDQGIDLRQGQYDFYAVMVPTNNASLLRAELQAISGNPNLYLRVGSAPTLNHYAQGSADSWDGQLVDRQLTGNTTEYGNWVPLNGRYEAQLTPGLWVLAVQAAGNANVRYRLQLSCGNPITNGLVQDLALNGGTLTNQNLNGGDWRYYRVQIPDPAPANWVVNWSRSLGSARMFVRDTVPPGDGRSTGDYSDATWNPGTGNTSLQTWNTDSKNQGPYPRFDTPGQAVLSTPPLRPGTVYYVGFWSPNDTTFSLSSSTNGGPVLVTNLIDFYAGTLPRVVPAHGTLLYRMNVPSSATRILFSANNSANVFISVEQGTIAQPGGPAHWTSYDSYGNNQANINFNQPLWNANNWPWQPGQAYYLALTNISATPETVAFNLASPADLSPTSFHVPSSVTSTRPSPSIVVDWAVTNVGPAATLGNWYDTVWFSANGALDANSINLGNFWVYSQTVPAGGSYVQTNTVTLPMSASGNYTLFVQVDTGNSIYEANVADKISAPVSGTFTLTPPDLMPVSLVQNVGGLTNLQTLPGPFPESIHPYTNNTDQSWTNLYAGAQALLITFDPQCAGEACCDRLHILNGSGNEIAGSPFALGDLAGQTKQVIGDTVVLRLTSDGSVTGWGFAVKQIQSGTPAPGAPVVSSIPNPGVQVVWGVTNRGIGLASGGWYDRVWFSTNGVLDSSSIGLGDFYFSQGVPVGGYYAQTNSVTLPLSLGGTYNYTLFVQVDIYNWVYESNKANNVSAPVQGTLTLDLPPQIVTQPLAQIVPPGTNVTLSIAANGTLPLRYQWQFNSSNLLGATNAVLVLNNVQSTNSGNYLVVVTNAFGTATSTTARLVVAAPGTNCTSAPAGLVAWWPGEGNANDSVGAHNGSPVGGVTFPQGEVGQAFNFGPGLNSYVDVPDHAALRLTNVLSIEFWAKRADLSTVQIIAEKGGDWTAGQTDYGVGLHVINNFMFYFYYNGGWVGSDGIGDLNWHHYAVVASNATSQAAFYIDGVQRPQAYSGGNATINMYPSAADLHLGAQVGSYSDYSSVALDELALYNRALSFYEIATLYLAGSHGKCGDVPPAILTQPQSQISLVGSNVVFSVSAVGEQPLSYQWQRNGVNLHDVGNIVGSTSPSLMISNISSSDAGTYVVVVSNAVASLTSANAVLSVNILQNGGFESGTLNAWTESGNVGSSYLSGNPTYDHSGSYGVETGPGGSLGYLSQTIPTQPGTAYLLSFWFNSQGGTPNEFLVSWNGANVFDQVNLGITGWTNMQFTVTATVTNTVLRFGFRNDPNYFGLDDISVTPLSAPLRLASVGLSTNGGYRLAVYGQVGQAYTLQASANLANWVSVLNFTCTNTPTYVLDPAVKNYRQRLYRVAQGTLPVTASPIVIGFGSAQPWTTNGLSLVVQGPAGANYTIQASTNLKNWLALTNFVNATPPLYFTDSQAKSYKQRYYQAVTAP